MSQNFFINPFGLCLTTPTSLEPDVRSMDGVYPRYLPRFPEGGRLLLEVQATGVNGAVSVVTQRRSGE